MALKYLLTPDVHASLPAEQQALYKARENGEGFALDVEIAANERGELEDVAGLRSALAKERANVGTHKTELIALKEQYKGLTPEQLATQKAALDAQSATLQETIAASVKAETEKLQAPLRAQIAEQQRYNDTTQAIDAAKGNRAVLLAVIKDKCEFTGDGKVKFAGTEHDNIAAALVAIRAAPEYGSCFAGSGNSGGGIGGDAINGGGTGSTTLGLPKTRSKMSIAQKAAYISAHGTDEFMRLPA